MTRGSSSILPLPFFLPSLCYLNHNPAPLPRSTTAVSGAAVMSISGMLMVGAPSSVAASRAVAPPPSLWIGGWKQRAATLGGRGTVVAVECSSRPNKKATSHHMKTRPKKTQPWDVRRKGPTAYAPLPKLPPDWTLASSQEPAQEQQLPQGVAAGPAAS